MNWSQLLLLLDTQDPCCIPVPNGKDLFWSWFCFMIYVQAEHKPRIADLGSLLHPHTMPWPRDHHSCTCVQRLALLPEDIAHPQSQCLRRSYVPFCTCAWSHQGHGRSHLSCPTFKTLGHVITLQHCDGILCQLAMQDGKVHLLLANRSNTMKQLCLPPRWLVMSGRTVSGHFGLAA